ncbi:hypothetical protein ACYJW8_01850 [Frateuria aurantia]
MVQGAGYSNATSDSYLVVDYIESRDALRILNRNNFVLTSFSTHGDFIGRFHRGTDSSFESLWRYYKRNIIKVKLDEESSIITLETHAYDAKSAKYINDSLLRVSEDLVNKMNARATADAISFSKQQLKEAEQRSSEAAIALANYRQTHLVFDPSRQSAIDLQQAASLRQRAYVIESEITQLKQVSPKNSQLPVLETSLQTLRKQLQEVSGAVTGNEGSLSQKNIEYTRLELNATFADRELGSALASLVSAQEAAGTKQLYLERLVEPSAPDEAILPKRMRGIFTVLLAGLLVWAILSLFISSMLEHKD